MSHTYISDFVHIVFSTKERAPTIGPEIKDRLWSFLGGIARKNGFKALAVGGTTDHVHLLISLPATLAVAKAVQLLKGGSSKWLNEIVKPRFEWQEGYGAFSVGISQENATISYINSQEQHHRIHSFEDEFLAFLRRHHIEYDSRYVLG